MTATLTVVEVHPMPFPWFRCVDGDGRVWGSGETAAEARRDAEREIERRGLVARPVGGAA